MKKLISLLLLCLLAFTGRAAIYVDEITASDLSGLTTTYKLFTVKGAQSGVDYKMNVKGDDNGCIVIANNSGPGIYATQSTDLRVSKVEVEYPSNPSTLNLEVYGKNSEYGNFNDWWYEPTQGTYLGTINPSTPYINVSGNYKYFIFGPQGQIAVSKIIVTWDDDVAPQVQASSGGDNVHTATLNEVSSGTIVFDENTLEYTADDGSVWTCAATFATSTEHYGVEWSGKNDTWRGYQFGKNNAAISMLSLSTPINGKVTSVAVVAAAGDANKMQIEVKVGSSNTSYGKKTISSTSNNTYTFTGSTSGDVTVTITNTGNSTKAVYVREIIVTYETVPSIEGPAAPTFNPTSCSFVGSQNVEISCATEDALIEYSFDESNWSVYSTDLTITDTKTIYARATYNGDVSAVASAKYTKILPPEAPVIDVQAGTYTGAQTVSISCATTGATIQYSYDNSTWTDYSEALIISESKTLYARASNAAGTSDVVSQTYTILFPPANPLFNPAGGEVYKGTAVTVTSEGASSIAVNGTTITGNTFNVTVAGTYTAVATNSDGTAQAEASYTLKALPAPTISVASGAVFANTEVTISLPADAPEGTVLKYSVDGGAAQQASGSSVTLSIDVAKSIQATAEYTLNGSTTTSSASADYTIDTSSRVVFDFPTIYSHVASGKNETYTNQTINGFTIKKTTGSASYYDSGSAVRFYSGSKIQFTAPTGCYINKVEIVSVSGNALTPGNTPGNTTADKGTLSVSGTNATLLPAEGGNLNDAILSFSAQVRIQKVTIYYTEINTPSAPIFTVNGSPLTSPATVFKGTDVTISSNRATSISINDGTAVSGNSTTYRVMAAGTISVTAENSDGAATGSMTFALRTVAEPVFIGCDPGKYYEEKTVEINCETAGAVIWYSTDNGNTWTEYSTPLTVSATTTIMAKGVVTVNGEVTESEVRSGTFTISTDDRPYVYIKYSEHFSSNDEVGSYTDQGITINFDKSKYYTGCDAVHFNSKHKLTITPANGLHIDEVVIVSKTTHPFEPGTKTGTTKGAFTAEPDGITFHLKPTGSETNLDGVILSSTNSQDIVSIKVYYSGTIIVEAPSTPVFTPAAGAVYQGTKVTITSAGATSISYTVDSGNVDAGANDSEFIVKEAVTVTATGSNTAGDATATASYTIKTLDAPTFSIEAPAQVTRNTHITVTAPEGSVLKYTVDGGETQTASGNTANITIDADKTIVAWAEVSLNGYTTASSHVTGTYAVDPNSPTEMIFTLATASTELREGDKIIIVAKDKNKAMRRDRVNLNDAGTSTSNNIRETAVTINSLNQILVNDYTNANTTATGNDLALVLELKKNDDNSWSFLLLNGNKEGQYLDAVNATGTTKTAALKTCTEAKRSISSKASISITDAGVATISFAPGQTPNRNTIRYNVDPNSRLFNCYAPDATGYTDVEIYLCPGMATVPGDATLDHESGSIVNGTEVTATATGASSYKFKFVPATDATGSESFVASPDGKYTITQSGTLSVCGVNGIGDGAVTEYTFAVALPEPVVAFTDTYFYRANEDNPVVRGTEVTFTSEGADDYTYTITFYDEDDIIAESDTPVTLTIMKDCEVEILGSNSSGSCDAVKYEFSLAVASAPTFSIKNTPVEFTDGIATVDYGANVTIAAQNADAIRYTVYPYTESFDINNPGTPIQAAKTVESASTTYKIEGDVVIVARGLAGGAEGQEVVGKFLYTRARVSAPTFDVPGGIYIGVDGSTKVLHLSAVQGAEIWYYTSLDEDAPTFKLWNADMAADGITLDRSMTVYAYAKVGGNESDVVSNDYTIRSAIVSLDTAVDGELSPASFGISGSSYISDAYVSPYTSVPYSYMATTKEGFLQMASGRQGGIVSTFHTEAYVGDIWFCNHLSSGKSTKISIYGSNNAYTSVDDLYDPAKRGTLIGQFSFNDLSAEEKATYNALSDNDKKNYWIKIPRLGDTGDFQYKYVGICATEGTIYANFKIEWHPIQYNVGSNVYTFFDENGVKYPIIDITDTNYATSIAANPNQVVRIPSAACPDYMVPYGARLHITAENASHIRYSYTEDIADDVRSAETATNSTIEVPMTESHYVFAQGLIIGGERGSILGTNTRDFIRVRVKPSPNVEFFPEPGLYRSGTVITATVSNATGGKYKLIYEGHPESSAEELPIDENGQFSFTLQHGTDIKIEATNEDTENVAGGAVALTFDGDDNGYSEVTSFYHLASDDDVPSTPIANIKGGTAVKKGTTLSVLVDGAIYVRYLVAPLGTTHDEAHEVIANWSTVQPEGFSYNLAAPDGFVEGVTDLTTIDSSDYVETFDYVIEDDCVIFAVGFNTSTETNKEGKVGESDHNFGSYTIIRPQPVSFSYPAGDINMGSQVRMLCPGADEIYYELIYLDDDGNPVSETPITRTVSGDIASIRIEQPVEISAWGVISGARSLDVAEATYFIAHDKIFEQIFDVNGLTDGAKVIFGAYDVYNDKVDGRPNPIQSFAMSNTLYNRNVPGTPVLIEEGKIFNPSDDVVILTAEVNNEGDETTYSFYVVNDKDGKMYLTASPADNEAALQFRVPDNTNNRNVFKIEFKPDDYVNSGVKTDPYYAGDAVIESVNNDKYKYLAFNHESGTTIFNTYQATSFNNNYSGLEIYVLDPNAEVYPPVTPVFDPEIGGSYPQGTEITIFSAGASTLYYFFAPEGVVPDETTIYNYVSGDQVTLELTMPGTYYAYGSNSAGITEIVSNYYTVAEPGAPVFIPDPTKYEDTDRLVDVGTKVTISCDNVTYLAYTITDKATGDVLESDVIAGQGDGQTTTIDIYVMVDCMITAEGILGNSDAKVSSTEFYVNKAEDRVYHRISSTDELVPGEKYIIAAVSSTGSGSGEVFSGHGMGTITGASVYLDSYEINEDISRRTNGVVEIKNPSVFICEFEVVPTDDADYPYALLFTDEARNIDRYLGVKALDNKLEMSLADPNTFAGVIPDNYTTSIAIDESENATIKFGDVDSKSALLKYNSTADRFKAYFTGSAVQIYKRVYVPAKPSFEPNGGYYNIGDDPVEVTITSKYADSIYYIIYDAASVTVSEGTITTDDNDCISVTIPSPETANSYYIVAEGHRGSICGDVAESSKYEFGNAETYILIDNDEQIDRSYNYDNPDAPTVQYIIAYNHAGNTSAVRAMAGVRADGSGIAAYNANIAEDVISVPFTDTNIMRINLFYNGSTNDSYAFEDKRLTESDANNKWYLVFEDENGKLTKTDSKDSYYITIDSKNNSALHAKLDDKHTLGNSNDDLYIAYYVPGGYFLAATEEMIEKSTDYEWPQLFRTDLYRLVQPRVSTKKDADTSTGNYAIGKRFVGMSNKAAILSDYNTEKSASYADAPAAGITYRYTTDGSMPTMSSPELGDGFVFAPGYNEDGTLQELSMQLRIMAFNNDPAIKHSKSSVLRTYTSGIHVKNIAEYKKYADDKEHLYVIDGALGVAFEGASEGKREFIVYDYSDENNVGNNGYNYLVVQMPADDSAEDAEDLEDGGEHVDPSKNAWKGMHGYHVDFDHIDLMSLTPAETKAKYRVKRSATTHETATSQAVSEMDHTDGIYHVNIKTMVVDEDANGTLKAKRYSLYPNTDPDLDYLFNGEVVLANRYAKAGADEIYDNVEGYVFGREHPVFFVTAATPRNYKLLEPELYIFNRGAIGNEVANGSFMEDVFNPADGYTMTVDTPVGFNYVADGFPYDPNYMDIFYSKDGTDVTIENIISMGWKDETSLVGTESTKEYNLDWGDGETHTYTDYDYEQTPITTLPEADCGILRYSGPFYVTTKGWTHTGGSSAFNKVQIKAVCILHPITANKAHKWTPAIEIPVDIWDVDYTPASGNGQQSVRRRILESGVYKTAMSPQKTVNSGITTSVDRVSIDDNTGDAVYFNLQGVRMPSSKLQRGIYIKVCGSTATKVYVK